MPLMSVFANKTVFFLLHNIKAAASILAFECVGYFDYTKHILYGSRIGYQTNEPRVKMPQDAINH